MHGVRRCDSWTLPTKCNSSVPEVDLETAIDSWNYEFLEWVLAFLKVLFIKKHMSSEFFAAPNSSPIPFPHDTTVLRKSP